MSALRALPLALVLAASGCSNQTAFLVTGNVLEEYDNDVQAIHSLFGKGLKAGTITPAQYDAWADFLRHSQAVYPAAVSAWRLAQAANDIALQGFAWERLAALAAELVPFGVQVGYAVQAFQPKPGAAP